MTRTQIYVGVSALLANVVLLRAYIERPNFYSAAVYISQSNGSLMLLINLGLIITAFLGYGLQRLLYGPLRPIETEQLYDKAWFAVSETLLAMTIFRDDIGVWFFAMFLALLGGKVWQWVGEGRVEFLEQQPPAKPRLFHTRLMSSLLISVLFDFYMMNYCIDTILQEARPGMMVMFGFEYALLGVASLSTLCRYLLSLAEILITQKQVRQRAEARRLAQEQARQRREAAAAAGDNTEAAEEEEEDDDDGDVPGWEEKGRWMFYLDLMTDFIKSILYLGFFMILVAFHGLPIHIMRDLFLTLRSFIKRINDFIQYRNATRDMNARYPDATAEELQQENTCIVCREEMRPWVVPEDDAQPGRRADERQRAKKLPCGHILHFSCLKSWLERQQVCPTCRRPVLANPPATNTQQNNQGNQGNQGQQNQNLPRMFRFGAGVGGNPNQPQPQAGQPGQQQQPGVPPANRPQGNMRVFNFGPLRIALGNMRIPAGQNPNNNGIANMAQNLVNRNQNPQQGQNQNPQQPIQLPPLPAFNMPGPPGTGIPTGNPADIQADILRLQENIIHSIYHLHAQHAQLEYIHTLIRELHRVQRASINAGNGQELPQIAPLNPNWGAPGQQQMFQSAPGQAGAVMRSGDEGLPQGLQLPEGWTVRRLAPVQSGQSLNRVAAPPGQPLFQPPPNVSVTGATGSQTQTPSNLPAATQALSQTLGVPPPAMTTTLSSGPSQPHTNTPLDPWASNSSQGGPSSSTSISSPSSSTPSANAPRTLPTATLAESSNTASLQPQASSSWSFDTVGEGSSSAVEELARANASESGSGSGITRRTATVEDAEEEGDA